MKLENGTKLNTGNDAQGLKKRGSLNAPAINNASNIASKKVVKPNVPKAISNKKRSSLTNTIRKSVENRIKGKNTNSTNDTENNDDEVNNQNKKGTFKEWWDFLPGTVKFKIILYASGGCLFIIVVLILIMTLGAILNGGSVPVLIDVDSYENSTQVQETMSNDEKMYYQKLDEIVDKYKNSCKITIDKNYLNVVLRYPYYNLNSTKIFNSESGYADLFDYNDMTSKIETVANLMVDNCTVDYKSNGIFYNNLKNSSFFDSYYSDWLKDYSKDEIIDSIFNYAESASSDLESIPDTMYISSNLNVNVINGNYNIINKTLKIKDYIAGNAYANIDNINSLEKTKAYSVLSATNILASTGYVSNVSSINVNNNSDGVLYCNPTLGCSKVITNQGFYLVDGGSSSNSGGNIYLDDKYYYKKPLSTSEIAMLNEAVDTTFGDVVLDNNNLNTIEIKNMTVSGNYKEILSSAYKDYSLTNIKEDTYTNDVSYGSNYTKLNVAFYDQNNYSNTNFCGRNNATIKSSGCGTTAMAMIASTLVNNTYNPILIMNDAKNMHQCGYGISGTNPGFFQLEARKVGLKFSVVSKSGNLNKVTSALSSGNSLVIAHMGPGTFTSGGHYIVLAGIDANTKRVFVYDSNDSINKVRRSSGNGWYSFNDIIVKQAKKFYIFTKG